MYRSVLVLGCYLAVASCAALAQDRPDFTGTWKLQGESQPAVKIKQTIDTIQISRMGVGDDHKTAIDCSIYGKECKAIIDGSEGKSSFWYNGSTLVQFTYKGKDGKEVVRTRREMSDDGNQMIVEIVRLAPNPSSDPEKRVYVRAEPLTAGGAATTASAQEPKASSPQ